MKRVNVRNLFLLAAILLPLILNAGCATMHTIDAAKGDRTARNEKDDKNGKPSEAGPQPAYYLLLPLTIPFDIATSPIQGLMILMLPPC